MYFFLFWVSLEKIHLGYSSHLLALQVFYGITQNRFNV